MKNNNLFLRFKFLILQLAIAMKDEKEDEADKLRDDLDLLWLGLTVSELKEIEEYSANLYNDDYLQLEIEQNANRLHNLK